MTEAMRYIVLTEKDDVHLVAIRRPEWEWLRVVAVFSSKDRADSYADVENAMADGGDDHRSVLLQRAEAESPEGEDPGSRLRDLADRETTPLLPATPGIITLADEILKALPELLLTQPKGPTVKTMAVHLGAEEHHIRRAMRELHDGKRAIMMGRKDSGSQHLIPLGYTAPKIELTAKQAAVLKVLIDNIAANGCVQIANRTLCELAEVSPGAIVAILDSLRHKKRIEIFRQGRGSSPTIWRVVDDDCSLVSEGPLVSRFGEQEGAQA